MKNKRNSYWESRANSRIQTYHKDSNEVINRINNAYDKAIKEINQDINNMFYQFVKSSELTDEQAKKLLNQKIPNPLIIIYKKILPFIGNEDIKQWFINRINSRAYKARITRLEALKESIYANIKRVANVEVEQSQRLYINHLNNAYYKNTYDIQKGIGQVFDFSPLPGSFIEEVLKSRWSGKNYSERVWDNSEVLAAKLEEVVTSGLMSGKSSRRMAKELEDMTMYGKFATERLIRTETTYITNQGEIESYKAAGIEEYIFLATLDLRTSDQCRAHDNKKYKVSEAVPGENLPPLHPYCRSTTGAYIEGMKRGQRRARDPVTGKTYLIDNMDYGEWYQKFVVEKYGEQDAAKFEKMIKNKSADKMQHEEYRKVLGNDAPKTFDNFRDLKYNNSEEYRLVKIDYSRRKRLIDNPELKLPNVEKATIADDKFTKYLFAGKNEDGLIKGKLITNKLGYNINNYKEFEKDILNRAEFNPSRVKGENKQGVKYEQRIIFYNKYNTPVNLEVGWLNNSSDTHMTSIYINEVKNDES